MTPWAFAFFRPKLHDKAGVSSSVRQTTGNTFVHIREEILQIQRSQCFCACQRDRTLHDYRWSTDDVHSRQHLQHQLFDLPRVVKELSLGWNFSGTGELRIFSLLLIGKFHKLNNPWCSPKGIRIKYETKWAIKERHVMWRNRFYLFYMCIMILKFSSYIFMGISLQTGKFYVDTL